MAEQIPVKSTDRELWREREGDYYADSLFVTKGGGIGLKCGGHVIVKPIREWHRLARETAREATPPVDDIVDALTTRGVGHAPPAGETLPEIAKQLNLCEIRQAVDRGLVKNGAVVPNGVASDVAGEVWLFVQERARKSVRERTQCDHVNTIAFCPDCGCRPAGETARERIAELVEQIANRKADTYRRSCGAAHGPCLTCEGKAMAVLALAVEVKAALRSDGRDAWVIR